MMVASILATPDSGTYLRSCVIPVAAPVDALVLDSPVFDRLPSSSVEPVGYPRFVAEATGAVWDGRTLMVWFREAGFAGVGLTTVSVMGVGAVDAVADQDAAGLRSCHGQATVSWQAACRVAGDGTAAGGAILPLAADDPPGPGGRSAGWRTFSVIVNDLDTGATAYLAGAATVSRLGR